MDDDPFGCKALGIGLGLAALLAAAVIIAIMVALAEVPLVAP